MKWISKTDAIRRADKYAIRELKVPGILLMEEAARQVALRLQKLCTKEDDILFLCGSGGNGGDGFAAARMMKSAGYQVRVFFAGEKDRLSDDARINYDMLNGYQISVFSIPQASVFNHLAAESEWVVDALFGTGLDREIQGLHEQIITSVNELHRRGVFKVLSIDIPSGIQGDTGNIMGCAIEADETVTFCRYKPGLLLYPGRDHAGHISVVDIGIPESIPPLQEAKDFMLEKQDVAWLLPQRRSRSHKGLYGHLLVAAGSKNMSGAAVLSAASAYKVGTGLVETLVPESIQSVLQNRVPEAISYPYQAQTGEDLGFLPELIEKSSAVMLGPGLSTQPYALNLIKRIVELMPREKPLVMDADALNLLSVDEELQQMIAKRGSNTVLTPHLGEASRLLNLSVKEIMDDPIHAAKELSKQYHSIAVLKDAMTLVCEPGGRMFYNTTGNNGMSTAGSGDVLSGMIGGLLAQGMRMFEAACCGVYLHGAAGDLAKAEKGAYGMTATDILKHIHIEKICDMKEE
ncbi:MAG: NAD(P)H-hydrate dehydratase [Firmicutes bacterium]|nr:NAD(P)H-hydrate dehydratase [Bacillota bacterium]